MPAMRASPQPGGSTMVAGLRSEGVRARTLRAQRPACARTAQLNAISTAVTATAAFITARTSEAIASRWLALIALAWSRRRSSSRK